MAKKKVQLGKNGSASLNAVILSQPEIAASAPVNAVAAAGVLTMDTQPLADDTMTIGTTVYTFTADGTASAAGEIDVGVDLADAKTLVIAAINGTDGNNDAHPLVSAGAFTGDDLPITALVKGAAGNAVATTETFDAVTNVFAAVTLENGVDGTDADAWEMVFNSGELYMNASEADGRGVETDTWYSLGATIVS